MDDMLTVKQAAEYLGVPRMKIYRLLRKGKLVAYGNPLDERQKLIRKAQLDELKNQDRHVTFEPVAA